MYISEIRYQVAFIRLLARAKNLARSRSGPTGLTPLNVFIAGIMNIEPFYLSPQRFGGRPYFPEGTVRVPQPDPGPRGHQRLLPQEPRHRGDGHGVPHLLEWSARLPHSSPTGEF